MDIFLDIALCRRFKNKSKRADKKTQADLPPCQVPQKTEGVQAFDSKLLKMKKPKIKTDAETIHTIHQRGQKYLRRKTSPHEFKKIFLKDDNFLIVNPNMDFRPKDDDSLLSSSNTMLTYNTSARKPWNNDSQESRIEEFFKRKCKNRLMGDEKCNCVLCNTLSVIKESLKQPGLYGWEAIQNNPPAYRTNQGKYVDRLLQSSTLNQSGSSANSQKFDIEGVVYSRIEDTLQDVIEKIDKIADKVSNDTKLSVTEGTQSINSDSFEEPNMPSTSGAPQRNNETELRRAVIRKCFINETTRKKNDAKPTNELVDQNKGTFFNRTTTCGVAHCQQNGNRMATCLKKMPRKKIDTLEPSQPVDKTKAFKSRIPLRSPK